MYDLRIKLNFKLYTIRTVLTSFYRLCPLMKITYSETTQTLPKRGKWTCKL